MKRTKAIIKNIFKISLGFLAFILLFALLFLTYNSFYFPVHLSGDKDASGANVYINGKPFGIMKAYLEPSTGNINSSFNKQLIRGLYKIMVAKEGYKTFHVDISIGDVNDPHYADIYPNYVIEVDLEKQ